MNRKERRSAQKRAGAVRQASPGATPEAALLAEGALHQQRGKLDEAVTLYKRLLVIQPAHAEALNNLACVLLAQGRRIDAAARFAQALTLTPELFDAYADIMSILREVNPALAQGIARATHAWPAELSTTELLGDDGLAGITADPLLRVMLEGNAVRDVGLERFLTGVRRAVLAEAEAAAATTSIADEHLRFCCALARQCFINEYVFAATSEELAAVTRLEAALRQAVMDGAPAPALWVAAIASYRPLDSLPVATALTGRNWPAAMNDLLTQQVAEPARERQLRQSIPRLTPIDDETSLRVRQQYEENPYPRWVFAPSRPTPVTIDDYLRREFPAAPFQSLGDRPIDMLIAGCGTGLHAVGIAQRFKTSQVTAVDLSLASLGYAKRKTEELRCGGIEYAQADLLRLDASAGVFDVVDASGVLHHLADPMAGWRALLSLLRPGGLMRVGLYSDIARRDVAAARAFVAERGYAPTADDIRRCRQDVMASPLSGIARYYDFFSTSECRDLMFHVQEHRLTLPQIEAFLRENDLAFIGFELSAPVRAQYARAWPDDAAMTNLGRWDAFERANPSTFASMYQFWVQKR